MKRRQILWERVHSAQKMLGYAALLTTSMMLACEKKVPEPDCGCESKDIGFMPETSAQYRGDGLFMVYDTNQYQRLSFYTVCDFDPTWRKSDEEVHDYRISGYYKNQCLSFEGIPLVTNNPLVISSIVLPK